MIEERLTALETKVDDLAQSHAELRTEVTGLRTEMRGGFAEVRGEMGDLRHYMGVLHEDTVDKIKALTPDPDGIRSEFRAADDALREEINRRLDPVERAVRAQATKRNDA